MLSPQDARKQIDAYIYYYNFTRLHSSIGFITPYEMLTGQKEKIVKKRKEKLAIARLNRNKMFKFSTLFTYPILPNSI
ncbi:MAG: transposase [Planctomycetes bacterium]|nr:transposase [Planctomycetota bacterium]